MPLSKAPSIFKTISFDMKIARALEAYSGPVFERNPVQKELPSSFKKIVAGPSTIHLTGSKKKRLIDKILKFASEVAGERKSRFILTFHPSHLLDSDIYDRRSSRESKWTNIKPRTCFFRVFHDWTSLVSHLIAICHLPDYQQSEPLCILFPSDCSNILNKALCDIPAIGRFDPASVSFHGQLSRGQPLTWLPTDLAVAGTPLYTFPNVFGLGFISVETRPLHVFLIFFRSLAAGLVLGLTLAMWDIDVVLCLIITFLVFLVMLFKGFEKKEVTVRRMRSTDGMSLMALR